MAEENIQSSTNNSTLIQPMNEPVSPLSGKLMPGLAAILLILLGVGSGYGIYALKNRGTIVVAGSNVQVVNTPTEEGVRDAAVYKDTATGTLQVNDGKITKEGSHVLIRGDASQNAYLTSSVVDLDKYVGKKVQIWGETFQGQKAGWLMDVGRIKVVD